MDLIAIDIGNSNVSLGVFKGNRLVRTAHVDVLHAEPLRGIIREFRDLCGAQALGARTVPVAVSSVNGKGLTMVEEAVREELDQHVLLLGREFPILLKMAVENPETVGTDRLLSAWAAYEVVQNAVVVAAFGTATSIDCVNQHGIFLGGVIMPGLKLSAMSLHEHTFALPEVEIRVPEGNYGTNTVSAIQNGIYYGALGALRELVERYATQLGHWPQVVITGGFCKMIAEKCDFVDSVVPDLCLYGLFHAYQKYIQAMEEEFGMKLSESGDSCSCESCKPEDSPDPSESSDDEE